MKLTKKQTIGLDYLEDNVTREVLVGGGAGGGKSALLCYWHLKRRVQYPETRGLLGRAKLKTLKETTLKTLFEIAAMQGLKAGVHYEYNQTASVITYWNGSETLLKDLFYYPSDANFDELGSLEITDAAIDEANQIVPKAKAIVASRIRYKLDQYKLIPKIGMSCNPAKNWVYTDFYQPYRDGTLRPDRQFVQSLVTDNPHISPHYIENLKQLPEAQRQRLLFGNWDYDNDPARLIDFEDIQALWSNKAERGEKFISCDVARMGKDRTTIYLWDGWVVTKMWVFEKNRIDWLVDKLREIAKENGVQIRNVIIDEDGVGGGAVDGLRGSRGFVNNSRALRGENYANLKAQCGYLLAKKITAREMEIQPTEHRDAIVQELEQLKSYDMDKDTKLRLLPKEKVKEQIGRSPDFSDGLLMRMWFELGKGSANYGVM